MAQEQWLPQYSEAIAKAKDRQSNGDLLPTRDYDGAARLKVKTVDEMMENREEASRNAGESDKAKERPAAVN
ncbi:hypothetical protein D3C72_1744910 [compost metagenome]